MHEGEFPFCIARRFNVNPEELLALNNLTTGSISIGEIKIPQTGNPFPGSRALRLHPTTYTVLPNKTIYSIACEFGDVFPEDIVSKNGLVPPYTLLVGQILEIP